MAVLNLTNTSTLIIEAESLVRDTSALWQPLLDPTASGGKLMHVVSGFAPQLGTPLLGQAGLLTLSFSVTTPGTYYLSLRGEATGMLGASDTVSIGLDGKALTGSTGVGGFGHGNQWTTTPIAVTVTTAGTHSLDIWARQPGFALDEIALSADPTVRPGEHQAKAVGAFTESIGVNTHLSWLDSRYADIGAVTASLGYLGIHNVRDTISTVNVGARLDQLGDAGIKMDFFVPFTAEGVAPDQTLEWALQQFKAHAWMTRSIEGANEVDFWPVTRNGLIGFDGANALQRDLYTEVKADPVLSRFPVLQFTIGDFANYPVRQDMSAYADYGTTHAYTGDSDPPGINVNFATRTDQTVNGADPVVTTETGYGTSPAQSYGRVSELAQAKYLPELLAEQYAQGVKVTYLYQLFDPYTNADPTNDFFNYYGLYRADGTAKPAAVALHNMTSWLADPGTLPFTPGTLDYTLRGAPTSIGSTLLQKSNGTFMLMLWNDVKAFNATTGGDIVTPPITIQLDFTGVPQSLTLLDTLTGTATAITPGLKVNLAIPDHVVLLQIRGVPGSTAPVSATAPVVEPLPGPAPVANTVGLGSDTLTLKISQDYWQGAAQYTVSVDGVQQGGVETARAFHSDGLSDTLVVRGNWTAGQHTVSLKLLNDLYGGSASADRNLYLDSASYNGVTVVGAPIGTVSTAAFAVTDTTAATPAPKTTTIGTGTDKLVLHLAQDAWQGSAQYIVSVDGVQQGSVQVASAYYSTGQSDTLTVKGDWTLGRHSVKVAFTNDAYGGPGMDRNLYLIDATYDGVAVPKSYSGQVSTTTFGITDVAPTPVSNTIGTGSDTLVLKISQDAWQANAQYTVSVDGVQVGGVQTASAYYAVGQSDTLTVNGNWEVGTHTVKLAFTNDAYGGSAATDRNLYLNDASYNGVHVATAPYGNVGTVSFQVVDAPPAPKAVDIGIGTDSLVLKLSQDFWQGDAQYTISIDGVQQGSVQTVGAYHSTGQVDNITVHGDWALGTHVATVAFVNDAAGSTAGADRNLYLVGASYNGVTLPGTFGSSITTATLTVIDTAPAPAKIMLGSGSDVLALKISQDAWQGNAQYTVAIDGVQVGGVQIASAYHAAGQSDSVMVNGNWGVGTHAVTVTFLNDAYGGAAARDRNLYLDEVKYDGRLVDTYNGNIATATFTVIDNGAWG